MQPVLAAKGELCSSGEPSTTQLDRPLLELVRGGQLAAVPRQDCLDARLAQARPLASVRLHMCCIQLMSKLARGGQLAAASRQDCLDVRLTQACPPASVRLQTCCI